MMFKPAATDPECDKEIAREAYAAGREWALANSGVDYDIKPLSFEEWWVRRFGEDEK
jgi:hypothetical protein